MKSKEKNGNTLSEVQAFDLKKNKILTEDLNNINF
jgi:hypothetical protein